jgi:hypothetical protein
MINRWVLVLMMLIMPTASQAQQDTYAAGSPAIIAFDLYTSCIKGEFVGSYPMLSSTKEIDTYVTSLDNKCVMWTVIWFPPFVGYTIDNMNRDRLGTFSTLRQGLMDKVVKQLYTTVSK